MTSLSALSLFHPNPEFPRFIDSLLRQAGIRKDHRLMLTDDTAMIEWTKVFTSSGTNPQYNYELYETFGDTMANNVVLWYYKKRFPQHFDPTKPLQQVEGMGAVGVLSRLKQVGVSKKTFAKYANELGFRPFIRATEEEIKKSQSILEDVFEAFIGCLANMVDTHMQEFFGYGVAFTFMQPLLDREVLSLKRDVIFDPKSLFNEQIGPYRGLFVETTYQQDMAHVSEDFTKQFKVVLVIRNTKGKQSIIYTSPPGFGAKKKEAEQQATKFTLQDRSYQMLIGVLQKQKQKYLESLPAQ